MLKYDFKDCNGKVVKDISGHSNNGKILNASIVATEPGAALRCSEQSSVVVEQSETLDTSDCPLSSSVRLKVESDGTILSQGEAYKGAWPLFREDGIPCFGVRDIHRIAVADGMKVVLANGDR